MHGCTHFSTAIELPYPDGNLGAEIVLLFFLSLLDVIRILLGKINTYMISHALTYCIVSRLNFDVCGVAEYNIPFMLKTLCIIYLYNIMVYHKYSHYIIVAMELNM